MGYRDFLSDVEGYLDKTGMAPTAFGVAALNDPRFVFDLRRGRRVQIDTLEKIQDFMSSTLPTEAP